MAYIHLAEDKCKCSGCGACLVVCPSQAISMEADAYGCLYPKIDDNACIRCGKCIRICTVPLRSKEMVQEAYAAVGRCGAVVENSASGGVFVSVAKECLREGFSAAGAVMQWEENQGEVFHILSDREEDICRMQGSKYVQSEAWKCYADILTAVKAGRKVLFTGTPCQVAAVRKLAGDPENLITMDLICHGVPPIQMLNDYVQILAKRFRGSLRSLVFRDKSVSKSFCARMEIEKNGKQISYFIRSHHFSYYSHFLKGSIYRESCYACPYACRERVSDITIGDYWGIEQFHKKDFDEGRMPRRNDWSCILVNSEKGWAFLQRYGQTLQLHHSQADWIAANNQQLNRPSKKPENRETVLTCYRDGGYGAVEDLFIRENGGYLRFFWRMARNMHQNRKNHNEHLRQTHEN